MNLDEIRDDLAAFADEEEELAIDPDGSLILMRSGREIHATITEDMEGRMWVESNGVRQTYRNFLVRDLAQLHVFAERLITRRIPVPAFVDGPAVLRRPAEELQSGGALDLLAAECESLPPFAARISFITADAGHGKTALLREHQARQARAFLDAQSGYLFWHVDLQGRQLLRLSEALMGDLGDLRISGLWMPAVIRLIRHRALILAIDGFDELAAEQGGTDALGALATLVSQLQGRGAVIAAARKTFFDTEGYLRRAGVMRRAIQSPCQFDELSLRGWRREEGVQYLTALELRGERIPNPSATWDEIRAELGEQDSDHPMTSRPFLLAQVARGLLTYGITPADFIRTADDPLKGVATVVEAFVRREVEQKWVYSDTGEPYLSVDQHMQLLADVAEEMYRSQKDRLDIDVIETIATLLVDQWGIDPSRRQQVLEMVRSHVLLVTPPDADARVRSFDHPEFRDYFTAYSLKEHLRRAMLGEGGRELAAYLGIAQITDATARYVFGMLERTPENVATGLAGLEDMIAREWKPTFLQTNVGTLIPFLLDGIELPPGTTFSGRVIFSSVAFERSRLSGIRIIGGSFVNVSLHDAHWERVVLEDCDLGELEIGTAPSFRDVELLNCRIEAVKVVGDEGEESRDYAPERIYSRLGEAGITWRDRAHDGQLVIEDLSESSDQKLTRRVLRLFHRTTIITEHQLKQRFKQDQQLVLSHIVPLLEKHGIVSSRTWKGAGQDRVWALNERLDDLLAAEGGAGKANLAAFWADFRDW
jgi:hypothetical protein